MEHQARLKVFLCHSSNDKPAVRKLFRRLTSDQLDTWLDEESLLPGQDWNLEIRKAVRESDVVIVCLSRTSINKTGYVQKEISFALDIAEEQPEGKIYLIPLRLEPCSVPERLKRWQWVDLFDDKGFDRLMRSLRLREAQLSEVAGFLRETGKLAQDVRPSIPHLSTDKDTHVPSRGGASPEKREPRYLRVTIQRSGDGRNDARRVGDAHRLLQSFSGQDRFVFYVTGGSNGNYELDFPNDTTLICDELLARLRNMLGSQAVRLID